VETGFILEPLSQAVLRASVIGQDRRHRLARHVPQRGARHPTLGMLHHAEDWSIATMRSSRLVDPLNELAVVRVGRDLSLVAPQRKKNRLVPHFHVVHPQRLLAGQFVLYTE
jgi:hypothetical protein